MRYIENTTEFKLQQTVVCLGKFDGIHKGHQLLIEHMLSYKKQGYLTTLFTFALHPSNLFSDKEVHLIDTKEEKHRKLEELGVDIVVEYPFTEETATMSPENFIKEILIKKLDAKVVIVGKDFRFGHQRKGNVSLLRKYAQEYGYEVIVFDKLKIDHKVVSSTRIREEIAKGKIQLVNRLLGQPYFILGKVMHGQKLGRTIGIPTINQIAVQGKLLPPNGVYISKVHLDDNLYTGVTNIGCKPTVGTHLKGVETHILDFEGDLYGQIVKVDLYHYIRGEKKFSGIEQLKQQMQKDIEAARKYKFV